jgi:hypothetical protein
MKVVIRGDGVAAYCCAHLLAKAGFPVSLERVDRPRLPVILLGDQALALIRDVFEKPDLFDASPRIQKRVVAWGVDAKPLALEHSAVVVSEESLLDSIRPTLALDGGDAQGIDWTIFAARPLPAPSEEHRFGSRLASVAPVTLRDASDSAACWIESLENGWLFLVANAPGSGWLLSVGGACEELLGDSGLIAPQIGKLGASAGEFPAYARIAASLCAPGWLACGTAAMAFDPICGDGTAHAIREAILASAVIRAIAGGAPADELLPHYEARLTAGFRRHLALCQGFYRSGGSGPHWTSELASIDRGIDWCDARLGSRPEFKYQLRGFDLEAVR